MQHALVLARSAFDFALTLPAKAKGKTAKAKTSPSQDEDQGPVAKDEAKAPSRSCTENITAKKKSR